MGDDGNLKIWSDPWIPREVSRRPITPKRGSILTNVDELIDPTTGTWDSVLVKDIFWEEDATIILAMSVHEGRENALAWHYDKHGIFSVKSAYKVCRDELIRRRENGRGQGGCSQAAELIWDRIWKMKCPNKIKHFT